MPSKDRWGGPRCVAMLEELLLQRRAIHAAVLAMHAALNERFDRLERAFDARRAAFEASLQVKEEPVAPVEQRRA
jgi:hypothetical protein